MNIKKVGMIVVLCATSVIRGADSSADTTPQLVATTPPAAQAPVVVQHAQPVYNELEVPSPKTLFPNIPLLPGSVAKDTSEASTSK